MRQAQRIRVNHRAQSGVYLTAPLSSTLFWFASLVALSKAAALEAFRSKRRNLIIEPLQFSRPRGPDDPTDFQFTDTDCAFLIVWSSVHGSDKKVEVNPDGVTKSKVGELL